MAELFDHQTSLRNTATILVAAWLGFSAGCQHRGETGARPAATLPSAATWEVTEEANGDASRRTRLYADREHGFSLEVPAGWEKRDDPENVLTLWSRANDPNAPRLSVAVPKLPPHLPGLLPLGAVQSGYVDDLRKQFTDVRVQQEDASAAALPGTRARGFVVTATAPTGPHMMVALILLKGDRLYIMTGESGPKEFEAARAAFDAAVASWKWIVREPSEQ